MNRFLSLIAFAALAGVVGCSANQGGSASSSSPGAVSKPAAGSSGLSGGVVTLPSGLKYEDLRVGEGPVAETGMKAQVHYTGWLTDGTQFDSSLNSGRPYPFTIGAGSVIRGWDLGIQGMKVGGKRKLTIPSELGYGAAGYGGGQIPPNATLIFEVELVNVQ